jgi:hypothetical protein
MTPGQKLFNTYDQNYIYNGVGKKYGKISDLYPAKSWGQLTKGERERWESIAVDPMSYRWASRESQ